MPYTCKLTDGKYKLTKKRDGKVMGTHDKKKECVAQMRALYASEVSNKDNIRYEGYVNMYDVDVRIANLDEIHVVINAKGGDYIEALSLHNKLRKSGKRIITHVDPWAFSTGAVVALAGDEIYMVENGILMFHPPMMKSDDPKNSAELAHSAEVMKKIEYTLINTLVSKSKRSEEECRKVVMNSTYFTAQEAMDFGIVDEVIPICRDMEIRNEFPDRIVNFLKEKQNMPLQELCDKFGVKDETALEQFISGLQANQKPREVPVSDSIVNTLERVRTSELDMLVSDGHASPAVVNELRVKFVNKDRIKTDCQTDNQEFDTIVNAFKKNERIISFSGKTGTQPLPKSDPTDPAESDLVKNAKKRAEKSKSA